MSRPRVAILISGRGTNMAALVEAAASPDYPAEIGLVFSNKDDAAGLKFAQSRGIATATLSHRAYSSRRDFDHAVNVVLQDAEIDFVCLAGFMRLLTPEFVAAWRDRMINIHPSLLPLFPGLHTHEAALRSGVRFHGCTVHFVRAEMDSGPIIAQAAVPVHQGDTPDILAARVLEAEHRIYPMALALLARNALRVENERVVFSGNLAEAPQGPLISPLFR